MSLFYDSDEYELSTSVETDNLLAELPFDLIKESIVEQIADPVSTRMNYIDIIMDKCAIFSNQYSDNEDFMRDLNQNLEEFFTFIITEINDRFGLGLDIDTLSSEGRLIETGQSLYKFFVLKYIKNISKFVTKYIFNNKSSLVAAYADRTKKDVSTLALKKHIKNPDDLVIASNLSSIIKSVINSDIEPSEFVELCSGANDYDANIVRSLIDNDLMIGDFVDTYIQPSMDQHDYILDEIYSDIKLRVFKKI